MPTHNAETRAVKRYISRDENLVGVKGYDTLMHARESHVLGLVGAGA